MNAGLVQCSHHFQINRKSLIQSHDSVNPLPDDKILDWSKLKQIAEDISKSI